MSPLAAQVEYHALTERFERLPIAQIVPSKTNPRKHFDPAYLEQLALSVAEKGVIEPIVVRQVDAGSHHPMKFEIVAGECRFRAATIANLTHLPAIVRVYTDEQALEIQLVENICRHDLTPLEQAAGYRALITSNPDKHSAASIATRIGMSPAWVWDRLKLNDLVPEAKQLLEQERMAIGHAILIARQKPDDQKRILDPESEALFVDELAQIDFDAEGSGYDDEDPYARMKPRSVRELERWITEHIRFDVAHAAQAQPLVFEETAAKMEQAVAQPGRGKKVIPITHEYRVADDARDDKERTYGSQSWERADGWDKSNTCEHSVLGVVVTGQGQGETFQVCVARDRCRVHFGAVIKAKEQNAKLREAGKGKQAAKNEQRQQETWQQAQAKRDADYKQWQILRPLAVAACVEKIKPAKLTDAVLQSAIEMLSNQSFKAVTKLLGGRVTAKNFTRALAIVDILDRTNTREYFARVAKQYKVDLAKLEKDLAKPAAAPAKGKA